MDLLLYYMYMVLVLWGLDMDMIFLPIIMNRLISFHYVGFEVFFFSFADI